MKRLSQWILFLTFFILCQGCEKEDDCSHDQLHITLVSEINRLRQAGCQCGADVMPPVPPLVWNDELAAAALGHVTDMYVNHYFEHISPDGSSPISRAQEAGYTGNYVGENIAQGYSCVDDVVEGWRESESHCKAMMDTLYLEMGAATLSGLWVLDFGRPDQ
jgi:uncharacterized protein YkwD